MTKVLTLNTHSWMQANTLKKLVALAEHILAEKYDIICLQEINQLIESELATDLPRYQALSGTPSIHKDHFALLLIHYLQKRGQHYYWSWAYNHIGYDIYQEGVAILSKQPIRVSDILVSAMDDETDYHTRRSLIAKTTLDGKEVAVVNVHLSWFDKGFLGEWEKLEKELLTLNCPLLLMGDFNNPTDQDGYQVMMGSPLDLQDSHKVADHVFGDHSIVADIDGWQGNKEALKVDHVFTSKDFIIRSSKITFEGGDAPVVSDHYGLEVTLDWR
ncbi:TPA: endonuclease/exonuclease/phosphatase family protein [Streptococcus pyogenes]|uniref:endonuclease/exonuclease/phosphatase family protein n=1 Tax=Streptococcus pyogenes TaxID=1314 RepID=UPI00109C143F|nr:endonuclease/exonuclease/phosphatase family protein [Streptococcus pyogenes]VHF55549.1 exodeoxyribonuclease III [Streptococcus pyogenes]VHM36412.1 exodeoxyribonuclease III [Streptococcus pyogenes]HEP1680469.1 endonuclease/exonuclease/phosphatase family protein [Streptococcus pyogenes]HEP2150162.1 endonuclease/exonuclease/phosphatase family protein [Streptococcus pyogenes]HER6197197.1 endonuclease/exonuclease/phosphatase family protein [Streptococcus pyogenes]